MCRDLIALAPCPSWFLLATCLLLGSRAALADELRAAGSGPDAESAHAAALAALSQQVLARVTSRFESQTRVDGEQISLRGREEVRVDGEGFFKGLEFAPPRLDGATVHVEVRLSAAAMGETAAFLRSQIEGDFGSAPRVRLEERLHHAWLLDALLTVPAARGVPDREELRADAQAAIADTRRLLERARIQFTGPTDATVELQGRPVAMGEVVFLQPGTAAFSARRPGHHPLQGRARVSAGERRVVPLDFVVARSRAPLDIEIPSDRHGSVAAQALTQALTPYGIELQTLVAGSATRPRELGRRRRCHITLRDAVTAAGRVHRNRLTISLTVIDGPRTIAAVAAHAEYTANRATDDTVRRRHTRRLVTTLAPRLVQALDARAEGH